VTAKMTIRWLCVSLLSFSFAAVADTTWFVVSEADPDGPHGDSYLLPLEDPADIAHARDLVANGPSVGAPIAVAAIAAGPDGVNRDVLAPGKPAWSWHVTEFLGFADNTIEILDGWPTFVEGDVEGWIANTNGQIGFWGYTVTAEIGQPEAWLINPGMNDAWVSADAPFQGFFFTVFPDTGIFFLAMFTFDSVPPPGDAGAVFGAPDQRWVTGAGTFSGNSATVSLELTSGGVFNTPEPLAVQQPGYGTITIVFNDCNEALLSYEFPGPGLSGEMTLTRAATDNVVLCQVLSAP